VFNKTLKTKKYITLMIEIIPSIIMITDNDKKLPWKRFILMQPHKLILIYPKQSLELCEDFIDSTDDFNKENRKGIIIRAEIVSLDVLEDDEFNIANGYVIMGNSYHLIFDEMMLNHLQYDLEYAKEELPYILDKCMTTLNNTRTNIRIKYNLPLTGTPNQKSTMMQNCHKEDFEECFKPKRKYLM
jgi:hypothetical protein